MKTSIWATCPKCQTELKIETNETELVQIECPECQKVFAAKVPPPSAAPVREVFTPMPALPPFQPAQVHYQPRRKSDDSLNPAVLTALIVVCASAILIPLGFGGYYIYNKFSEASQIAMSDSSNSTPAPSSNTNAQPSFPTPSVSTDPTPSFQDFGAQATAGRKVPSPSDSLGGAAPTAEQPILDTPSFGVPELNPPMLIQPEPASPETTQTPNSSPTTSGSGNPFQGQVSVTGAGTTQSGLPMRLQRFAGPSGVLIFVLHSNGYSVSSPIQELMRNLSVREMHSEGGGDHTTIGISYSGSVDSVVKGIRFGKVSYFDEESRSIHVKVD